MISLAKLILVNGTKSKYGALHREEITTNIVFFLLEIFISLYTKELLNSNISANETINSNTKKNIPIV